MKKFNEKYKGGCALQQDWFYAPSMQLVDEYYEQQIFFDEKSECFYLLNEDDKSRVTITQYCPNDSGYDKLRDTYLHTDVQSESCNYTRCNESDVDDDYSFDDRYKTNRKVLTEDDDKFFIDDEEVSKEEFYNSLADNKATRGQMFELDDKKEVIVNDSTYSIKKKISEDTKVKVFNNIPSIVKRK